MPSSADPIEACVRELQQARDRVKRMVVKQIAKEQDRDYLKSVANAWFGTHRKQLSDSISDGTLEPVDSSIRAILFAADRHTARRTYLTLLQNAKDAVASLRGAALVPKRLAAVPESPPDFSPLVADVRMKAILDRRWSECQLCLQANAPLAATVMMGGLLEALFVARANIMPSKARLFSAKAVPMDFKTKKALDLRDWTLGPYIDVGAELEWISVSGKLVAAVLRDYRNYIHPEKERSHGVNLVGEDAKMFWDVTKNLARQILLSASKP